MMMVINAAAVGIPAVRVHVEEQAGSTLHATSGGCRRISVVMWQIKPTLH